MSGKVTVEEAVVASLRTARRDQAADGSADAAVTAVEVASLSKRYGPIEAVKGVSFSVNRGEVFAAGSQVTAVGRW